MKYRVAGPRGRRRAVVKLEPGDEVIASLLKFCGRRNIFSGTITGLGAVGEATLGWFDEHRSVYGRRTWKGSLEIVGLTGNIARLRGEPILHCHVVCSGRDFRPFSGHLFSAVVSVTVECSIIEFGMEICRARDPRFGLNLLDM